jgi:hypothetical protein
LKRWPKTVEVGRDTVEVEESIVTADEAVKYGRQPFCQGWANHFKPHSVVAKRTIDPRISPESLDRDIAPVHLYELHSFSREGDLGCFSIFRTG